MADQSTTIPKSWKMTTLGDVAEKVAMGPFGSNIKIETFVDDGVPVISGTHLNGHKLEDKEYNFITPDHAEKLRSSNVFSGDIIFTHAGNIGQVAYIPENSQYKKYVLSQRQFYLRPKKELLQTQYLTYFFKTREGQHKLLANANQTGVPSIAQPASYLKSIEINLPPLPEQRAIAAVLSSLDDKIELLREQNKTLEATAQAIFKEWFVNFNFPGAIGKMFDSELGKIPKEWKVFALSEIVGIVNGYSYKGSELKEKGHNALVTLKSFDRKGGFQTRGFKPFIGNPKPEQEVFLGDLVIAHTDLTQDAEVLGNPAFIFDNGGYKKMYITMDLVKIFSKNTNIALDFYYYLMSTSGFKKHCVGYSNGTTVLHLSKRAIPEYKIALPNDLSLVIEFSKIAHATTQKIINNFSQIKTLSVLRDTLLPKLMKGEVRVAGFND